MMAYHLKDSATSQDENDYTFEWILSAPKRYNGKNTKMKFLSVNIFNNYPVIFTVPMNIII